MNAIFISTFQKAQPDRHTFRVRAGVGCCHSSTVLATVKLAQPVCTTLQNKGYFEVMLNLYPACRSLSTSSMPMAEAGVRTPLGCSPSSLASSFWRAKQSAASSNILEVDQWPGSLLGSYTVSHTSVITPTGMKGTACSWLAARHQQREAMTHCNISFDNGRLLSS